MKNSLFIFMFLLGTAHYSYSMDWLRNTFMNGICISSTSQEVPVTATDRLSITAHYEKGANRGIEFRAIIPQSVQHHQGAYRWPFLRIEKSPYPSYWRCQNSEKRTRYFLMPGDCILTALAGTALYLGYLKYFQGR